MPRTDDEMADLIVKGFTSIHTDLAKVAGDTGGRLNAVERQLQELSIKVGPVLRVFDNDLTTRIKMLEVDVEELKDQNKEFRGQKEKASGLIWAAVGFAFTSLLGVVGSLIWQVITSRSN